MTTGKKRAIRLRKSSGRGAIWVVVILLAASGGLRLVSGPGKVLAQEVADLAGGMDAATETEPAPCEPPADVAAVLAALDKRDARLSAREAALEDRASALALAEQEISRNLAALEQAEKNLASMVAISETAAEEDLLRLTAVYESMKPKEAAALFETMAADFAAGFLGRMRPDAAAAILAGLPPDTAYAISVVLAGRNANAPVQ